LAFADLPCRIRVGVTGHRAINEPEAVACKIREILQERIWKLFDPSDHREKPITPLAFTVLSSLAEGADRLVAQEVLKIAASELEVVLPLAMEDFLRDFSTSESNAEFYELLSQARKTTVLRETDLESKQKNFREKAYEAAGRYVVDHCDLLIAVWDGEPARGRGGTAEIIAYARSVGRYLVIVPIDNTEEIRIEK
jgi:hypothetical protein